MTAVQDSAEPTAKDNTTEAVPASIVASMPDESDDTSTFYQSWSPTHHDLRLPAPAVPPPEKYVPVEKFVAAAMEPIHRARGAVITTAQRSKEFLAIVEILHKRDDAAMLHYILLALRTGGHGTVLSMISADSSRYGPMFRLIFNLNPFEPPDTLIKATVEENGEEKTPKQLEEDPKVKPFYSYHIADAHLNLIAALVSANSVFVTDAIKFIWRMGTWGISGAPAERVTRIHAGLATLIRICPKALQEVFPQMSSNFPFKLVPAATQTWYVHQCLAVLKYAPQIHKDVLELLVDKCLEIDVEIKIEQGGDVTIEEVEKEEDNLIHPAEFNIQVDNGMATNDSQAQGRLAVIDEGEKTVDEMANKLDLLMLILFEHITATTEAHANGDAVRKIFRMIMPVFDSAILTTHRSKYVQFIVFLLCGLDHERQNTMPRDDEHGLYRLFAAKLIEIMLDPFRATTTRQSVACYLASFLSRSKYVCIETVCESLSALLSWTDAYMRTFPTEASTTTAFKGKDIRNQCEVHSLFYTVCQAAFYIMCFRGGEAVTYHRHAAEKYNGHDSDSVPQDDTVTEFESVDIDRARWMKVCSHHLNPLRYCLESVRGEFLYISEVLSLLDAKLLDDLIDEDKNLATRRASKKRRRTSLIRTPVTMAKKRAKGGVGGLGRGSNPLDSFFPFDPYLLRRSYRFVEPYYRNWEGGLGELEPMERENTEEVENEQLLDYDDQDEEDSSESSSCSESDDGVDDGDSLSNVGSYREEYHGVSLKSIVTEGFAASKSKSQSDLDRFDTLKNPLESGTELELERESSLTDREQGPAKWRRRADSVVSHGSW